MKETELTPPIRTRFTDKQRFELWRAFAGGDVPTYFAGFRDQHWTAGVDRLAEVLAPMLDSEYERLHTENKQLRERLDTTEALARHFNLNYSDGIERHTAADWTPEARAAVAAVHDLIATEALNQAAEDILTHRDELRAIPGMARRDLRVTARLRGLEEAAGVVRYRADTFRESLSRPTTEETPNG